MHIVHTIVKLHNKSQVHSTYHRQVKYNQRKIVLQCIYICIYVILLWFVCQERRERIEERRQKKLENQKKGEIVQQVMIINNT